MMNKALFSFFMLASIGLLLVASLEFHNKVKADQKIQEPITTEIEAAPADPVVPDPVSQTTYQIPILMYHHIRDYSDTSDQVGINLSVSPAKFATQLDLIRSKGYISVTFADIANGNVPNKPIILTFDDGYENFYEDAYPALKARGMGAVSFVIANDTSGPYMTKDQIIEISQNGIEIGSHTLSHPNLTKATPEKAAGEIGQSKRVLEGLIGKEVISFCYPSGQFNDAVTEDVRNAKYSFAVTTKSGIGDFTQPFTLKRYRVNHDTNINGYLK